MTLDPHLTLHNYLSFAAQDENAIERFCKLIEEGIIRDQTLNEVAANCADIALCLYHHSKWSINDLAKIQLCIELLLYLSLGRISEASIYTIETIRSIADRPCTIVTNGDKQDFVSWAALLNSIDLSKALSLLSDFDSIDFAESYPDITHALDRYLCSYKHVVSAHKHPLGRLPVGCFNGILFDSNKLDQGGYTSNKQRREPLLCLLPPWQSRISSNIAHAIVPCALSEDAWHSSASWIETDNEDSDSNCEPTYRLRAEGAEVFVNYEVLDSEQQTLVLLYSMLIGGGSFLLGELGIHTLRCVLGLSELDSQTVAKCFFGHSPTGLHAAQQKALVQAACQLSLHNHLSIGPHTEVAIEPTSFLNMCAATLDERESFIFSNRTAAPKSSSLTLKQVGASLSITRERVRQLEKKVVTKAVAPFQAEARMLVHRWQNTLLNDALALLLKQPDRPPTASEVLCAIPEAWHAVYAVADVNLPQLPASHLYAYQQSHLRGEDIPLISKDMASEAETVLTNLSTQEFSLPLLVDRIQNTPNGFSNSIFFTKGLTENFGLIETPEGLVLAENSNAHNTRVAGIISAYETHSDWLLSDQELWNVTTEGLDDQLLLGKWRSTLNSLQMLPHKYRRIPRVGWLDIDDLSLSSDYQPDARPLLVPPAVMGSTENALGNDNQRYELYQLISSKGALGAKEIFTLWGDYLGRGGGESASFLQEDPYFIRVHPGMTGCLDKEGCLVNKELITKILMHQNYLGEYLLLRTAGFGPHDFPAWDHVQLQSWIDWVKSNVPNPTQEIVTTQLEIDFSHCHKVSSGRLRLDPLEDTFKVQQRCRRPIDVMIPSAEEFFRLLALGTRFGFINFYIANCSSHRQWYSHTSVSWLAMMTACGAVSPTSHWQNCHYATNKSHELLHSLIPAVREHGELSWDCHPATRAILELIMNSWEENIERSWINKTQFIRLLSAMMDPQRRRGHQRLNDREHFNYGDERWDPRPNQVQTSDRYVDPSLDDLLSN
jgi:hypothetical protein